MEWAHHLVFTNIESAIIACDDQKNLPHDGVYHYQICTHANYSYPVNKSLMSTLLSNTPLTAVEFLSCYISNTLIELT